MDWRMDVDDSLWATKWPTFSDPKHPLKPDNVEGMAPPKVVLSVISNRLKSLWLDAKREGRTLDEWANHCGYKDYQTVSGWLEHPERMKARAVELTCDFFGVAVTYLRGETSWKSTSERIFDVELISALYAKFNDRHKELVTSVVRECLNEEYASKRADELNDTLLRLADRFGL